MFIDLNPIDNFWSNRYIWSKDYLVQGIPCLIHLILTCSLLPNDWSKDYLVQGIPCLVHLIFTWTGPSPAVQVDLVQGIHLPGSRISCTISSPSQARVVVSIVDSSSSTTCRTNGSRTCRTKCSFIETRGRVDSPLVLGIEMTINHRCDGICMLPYFFFFM